MGQCRPWDPGSISGLQHRASCTCSLKDIFMLLSFQFSAWQAIMCPGVRALLCPEMVPCEKHSVGVGRAEVLSTGCCQTKGVDGIIINVNT